MPTNVQKEIFIWKEAEFFLKNVEKLVTLIKVLLPQEALSLQQDISLKNLAKATTSWQMDNNKRLDAKFEDQYTPFYKEINETLSILKLKSPINPRYKKYHSLLIFGGTGLSYIQIWRNILHLVALETIEFENIIILGGNRKIHPLYDNLEIAYKYFSNNFSRFLTQEEILGSENELELIKLITSTLKKPHSLKKIPIYFIYAPGTLSLKAEEHQATTSDTILELIKVFSLPKTSPLLFTGTLPYIIRQGLQAKYYLPDHQIDICAADYPYLETINTPLKGNLPASLYLDELHWLLETLSSFYLHLDSSYIVN